MKVEIPAVGEIRGVLHGIGFRELVGGGVNGRGIGDLQKNASKGLEACVCRCSDLPALSEQGVHKHVK